MKNPRHWADLRENKIPAHLPILEFVRMPGMLNEDGDAHRTLRNLVGKAFTPRRVAELQPRIDAIVQQLIADLAKVAPQESIDLRHRYAFALPMQVICHLFGLDPANGDALARDYAAIHDSGSTQAEVQAGKAGVGAVIAGLIAGKRQNPGADLTSALIRATDGEGATLNDELLMYTLMLFLFAGHETTQSLVANALKALADHPTELARVRAGEVTVDAVVEEVLRYNSPINTIMFRYAAADVAVPGTDVVVKAGEAVVICVAAAGRDETAFGPDAHTFDPSRKVLAQQHLAFGHGVHYCIGAPLARMMASTAVGAFVDAFDLDRTGAPESEPLSSYSTNSDRALWGRLKPAATGSATAA
ncbi:cytochrome P450 [Streptomyces sp. NPDC005525]|uniref:cytochrome P450 n=1 Tax=Streptomyces sp. NPDC005525 TaxID=3364720 RepID=UPI0036CCC25A